MKSHTFKDMLVAPAGSCGARVREQLAAWEEAAKGAYSPNTQRAYRHDWFLVYCIEHGLESLPAAPAAVAAFLRAECERGRAVATVRRRAAAVSLVHRAARLTDSCKSEPVRLALRAIARELGTDQKQAAPLGHREAALARWLKLSGIMGGPAFRSVTRAGRLKERALGIRDVFQVLRGLARRSRISTAFSSHSLRVGMVRTCSQITWSSVPSCRLEDGPRPACSRATAARSDRQQAGPGCTGVPFSIDTGATH
jgi:hypothetical protein